MLDTARLINYVALTMSAVLVCFGALFMVQPQLALEVTYHQAQMLPYVISGRHVFFALMLAYVTLRARGQLPVLLAGFSFLGVYDAIIYWAHQPWPHLIVGVICAGAALYLMAQKEEQA